MGDNSFYRKFGRAITTWEAIQKRLYKADAKKGKKIREKQIDIDTERKRERDRERERETGII